MARRALAGLCLPFVAASALQALSLRARPSVRLMSSQQSQAPGKSSKFVSTPFPYHHELDVTIEDLTNMGMGVARHNAWVIFVPSVLPGEKVRVRIYKNEKSFSHADLVTVLEPSEHRVQPQCQHFELCGGCQYQHMDLQTQRTWKRNQVVELLRRIGGVAVWTDNVENTEMTELRSAANLVHVNDVIGTSHAYGYRSKITPHFDTPKPGRELNIGFLRRGTRTVADVDSCAIALEQLNDKYRAIKENIKRNPPKRGSTLLFRALSDGTVCTDAREWVEETVCGLKFKFKAGEFFQNNPYVLPLMVQYVLSCARGVYNGHAEAHVTHLVDAYCGVGLFSLSGSQFFQSCAGIEISEQAVEAAKHNAQSNGITNCRFETGDATNIFETVLDFPASRTAVVIDPPRKGCDEAFLRQLLAFGPKRIVYVSCDPATQARDTHFLLQSPLAHARTYAIAAVQPFDLFPQTRHIENVITFERF